MEVIRAILSIFLGLLFLGFIFRLAWPLLMILMVFIVFTVIRIAFMNKSYKNDARNRQSTNQRQDSGQRSQTSNTASNPDVFDAEYTEEELD